MANPNPSPETRFAAGNNANPNGKTSEQRRLEIANAEKATRIRAALLDQVVQLIDAGMVPELETNLLALIKTSEDRGLGAPKQTVDSTIDVGDRMSEDLREFRSKLARVAKRSGTGEATS